MLKIRLLFAYTSIAFLSLNGFAPAQDKFPPQLYQQRREALRQTFGDSSVMILFATPVRMREWDSEYEYHPDSDFLYLTGIDKPNAALLLASAGIAVAGKTVREIIFLPERNAQAERWFGKRIGLEEAKSVLRFEEALPSNQLTEYWDSALQKAKLVYLPNYDPAFFEEPISGQRFWIERESQKTLKQKYPQLKIKKATTLITAMRVIKAPEEVAMLQRVIDLTCASLREAMMKAKPGMFEYELEAIIEYGFKTRGAEDVSFPSIIGSGPNSTSPHYWENRRQMQDGEVVVMDVGADLQNYAADVTRTIPVNGKFSPAQREIYEIVWRAQEAAMQIVKPGVKFSQVHATAKKVIDDAGYGQFFIHGTSHGLGIDTHDPGPYDVLQPNMIFTIEPGIYIPENTAGIDRKYWNIGVRIEDDILVTPSGYKLMSASAPRAIGEIEKLMKSK